MTRNRSSLFGRLPPRLRLVMVALALISVAFWSGCGITARGVTHGVRSARNSQLFYQGLHGPLTKQEMEWSQTAWHYFQKNTNPGTGLVNGVNGQQQTTMWETGDYLAALLAAQRLKLINDKEFHDRFTTLLATLNSMQLAGGFLPNRYYSTASAHPVDRNGKETQVGWSALDLGRLLLWLRISRQRHPEFAEYIDKSVLRWDFCQALDANGSLLQSTPLKEGFDVEQDGRLGYEEYSAQGFRTWGFNTERASRLEPFTRVKVFGIELLQDGRDERQNGVLAPIVTMPYLLGGMELGWDYHQERETSDDRLPIPKIAELARRIYQVQEMRYRKDKILTARTDHRVGHPPYFVVDSIFARGYAWNTLSDPDTQMAQEALVATQVVFPMRVLWNTDYTKKLTRISQHLYESDQGWYEGRFEQTGGVERTFSLQTNAMVLESLLYQTEGRLYEADAKPGFFEVRKGDPYRPVTPCADSGAGR
jgi:Protein of unknown function (DUF3131)